MIELLSPDWRRALNLDEYYVARLERDVREARLRTTVYPREEDVFRAFELTPIEAVKAVIVGQDPYPNEGQACGLAFAVPPGAARPRSLRLIISTLERDMQLEQQRPYEVPADATLDPWPHAGVLLLNTALTVEAKTPGGHADLWFPFARRVLERLASRTTPIAFLLWGNSARRLRSLVSREPHVVVEAPHPAARLRRDDPGSFANRHPFLDANDGLRERGTLPVRWSLG